MGKQLVSPCASTTMALYLLLMNITECLFSAQPTVLSWVHWLSILCVSMARNKYNKDFPFWLGRQQQPFYQLLFPPCEEMGYLGLSLDNCSASDQSDLTGLRDNKKGGIGKLIRIATAVEAHMAVLTFSLYNCLLLSSWVCCYALFLFVLSFCAFSKHEKCWVFSTSRWHQIAKETGYIIQGLPERKVVTSVSSP